MRVNSSTRFAALAALVGALACAGNTARDNAEAAAARDTTSSDTLGAQAQNPPGQRGMERDTTIAPPAEPQPSDNQQGQMDTTSFRSDTTGAAGAGRDTTSMTGTDTSWTKSSGDTTGYGPSQQQPGDSTSR